MLAKIANQGEFSAATPSAQNAVDLFEHWTCSLPIPGVRSGEIELFDGTKNTFVQNCRNVFGSIQGWEVLELGSLEGANTFLLSQLQPVSIVAVEANPISYLKSLVAKQLLGFEADFLYGDFNPYMEQVTKRFDLVFATGVLYHMVDPISMLHRVSNISDRINIWTLYAHDGDMFNSPRAHNVSKHGYTCDYLEYVYEDGPSREYSGTQLSCNRMRARDIIGALKHFGFDAVNVVEDKWSQGAGWTIELAGSRTAK